MVGFKAIQINTFNVLAWLVIGVYSEFILGGGVARKSKDLFSGSLGRIKNFGENSRFW